MCWNVSSEISKNYLVNYVVNLLNIFKTRLLGFCLIAEIQSCFSTQPILALTMQTWLL